MLSHAQLIAGILCLAGALGLLLLLTHYAPFYAPSYFFWIGVVLCLLGIISLIRPLSFLFIVNRNLAAGVLVVGVIVSLASLFWPVSTTHSTRVREIDRFLPDYSFCEYHEVRVKASPRAVKCALQTTAVSDIPVIRLLLKIRGIDDRKHVRYAVKNSSGPDTFSTPDFNFFLIDSTEMVTVMLLNATLSGTTPPVKTLEAFRAFNKPGYIKVAVNFRFVDQGNGQTSVSTETRNQAMSKEDARLFARYWRIIYPGSAIIRRAWLDALARKAESV